MRVVADAAEIIGLDRVQRFGRQRRRRKARSDGRELRGPLLGWQFSRSRAQHAPARSPACGSGWCKQLRWSPAFSAISTALSKRYFFEVVVALDARDADHIAVMAQAAFRRSWHFRIGPVSTRATRPLLAPWVPSISRARSPTVTTRCSCDVAA